VGGGGGDGDGEASGGGGGGLQDREVVAEAKTGRSIQCLFTKWGGVGITQLRRVLLPLITTCHSSASHYSVRHIAIISCNITSCSNHINQAAEEAQLQQEAPSHPTQGASQQVPKLAVTELDPVGRAFTYHALCCGL